MVSTHLHCLDNIKEFVYLTEEIKLKMANRKLDDAGILTTSSQNSLYQALSAKYKEQIPTSILTSLNSVIVKSYNKEKTEYYSGNRSLRSYKNTLPIPFQAAGISNVRKHKYLKKVEGEEKEIITPDFAFTLFGMPFRTHFGLDFSNNKMYFGNAMSDRFLPSWITDNEHLISDMANTSQVKDFKKKLGDKTFDFQLLKKADESHYYQVTATHAKKEYVFKMELKKAGGKRAAENKAKKEGESVWKIIPDYKLCDSSIQISRVQERPKDGPKKEMTKIFLLAVFSFDREKFKLDDSVTAEVSLGIDVPMRVKIGDKTFEIGAGEGVLDRKQAIQKGYKRLQISLKEGQGSHGRKRKLRGLGQFHNYESDFTEHIAHVYSYRLIKYCLQFKVKTIVLMHQAEKEKRAKEDEFLLRNWGYFGLKLKIEYKAGIHGIVVVDDAKEKKEKE